MIFALALGFLTANDGNSFQVDFNSVSILQRERCADLLWAEG
jgi:hypothetical protein